MHSISVLTVHTATPQVLANALGNAMGKAMAVARLLGTLLIGKYLSVQNTGNVSNKMVWTLAAFLSLLLLYLLGTLPIWKKFLILLLLIKMIRQSGVPNFLGLGIPVNTQFKVKAWRHHLKDYWDQQLMDLIQYGFPLDFDRNCVLGETVENHASANEYASHVTKYIQEELQFMAMIGPFDEKPCTLHISPFMTRNKAQFELRCTIIDLCFRSLQQVPWYH